MKVGAAHLPLHGGKAPRWLFERMVSLGREITQVIVLEYGPEELLTRISHPYWFQSLGCVLGFDWHSSGLTTTTTGALKLGIKGLEKELGLYIAGGKGGTSRKTPVEIEKVGESLGKDLSNLVYASKMSAKVDSAALQDSFQLYHHNFFFTRSGKWAVVQQGMNTKTRWARRYHWLSDELTNFVNDPHNAIASQARVKPLNMVAASSNDTRLISTDLSKTNPDKVIKEFTKMIELKMPHHEIIDESDMKPENLKKVLLTTYERQPKDFETLLAQPGVGPKTIRSLALISELVYNAPASREDPVKYSFAHGGKDGTPYPVDKPTYDKSIEILKHAVNKAKIGHSEKLAAFRRLQNFL
jgi:uncharacterized protein